MAFFKLKNPNYVGAALMSASTFGFVLNDMLMQMILVHLSIYQGIVARGIIVIPLMLVVAFLAKQLFVKLARADWYVIIIRTALEIGITILFLTALAHLPLANVTAILQATPLIITSIAALFLGEHVGWRRWSAIIIGLIGVLIIVRPGLDGFSSFSLYALSAAMLIALRDLITRRLSREVPSIYVGLITAIILTLYALVIVLPSGWTEPTRIEWVYVIMAAIAVIAGYVFGIATMRIGEVSFVTAFRSTAIIWATGLTILVTGSLPDIVTIIGTIFIISAGLYCLHRENITSGTNSGPSLQK